MFEKGGFIIIDEIILAGKGNGCQLLVVLLLQAYIQEDGLEILIKQVGDMLLGSDNYYKSTWQWIDGNKDGVAECYVF